MRGLFYFALSRSIADYPICGGFVGEIRVTRPYHENDGPKLVKWAEKAQRLDLLPANAILKEEPGEHTILPEACSSQRHRLELWLNRSAFNPLLAPVCARHGGRAGLLREHIKQFGGATSQSSSMQDHNPMPFRPQPEELPFLRQPEGSISPGQTPACSRDQSSSGGPLSGAGCILEYTHGLPGKRLKGGFPAV